MQREQEEKDKEKEMTFKPKPNQSKTAPAVQTDFKTRMDQQVAKHKAKEDMKREKEIEIKKNEEYIRGNRTQLKPQDIGAKKTDDMPDMFKPKINPTSKAPEKKSAKQYFEDNKNRLESLNTKLEKERKDREDKELNECSFKPVLSK